MEFHTIVSLFLSVMAPWLASTSAPRAASATAVAFEFKSGFLLKLYRQTKQSGVSMDHFTSSRWCSFSVLTRVHTHRKTLHMPTFPNKHSTQDIQTNAPTQHYNTILTQYTCLVNENKPSQYNFFSLGVCDGGSLGCSVFVWRGNTIIYLPV